MTRLLIQDSAWPGYEVVPQHIVDGYSTLFREIDVRPDLVVVPMGVGSIAQAAVTHYRSGSITPALLGVEPASASCVTTSLLAGELVTVPTGKTAMAGLNCGTPSTLAWPVLRSGLDYSVTVDDEAALQATADLGAAGNLLRPERSRHPGRTPSRPGPPGPESRQHSHPDQHGSGAPINQVRSQSDRA